MDKAQLFLKVCEQFGSLQNQNPPMRIDWMPTLAWKLLFDWNHLEDTCLVYIHVRNRIGIAERNIKGYVPTPCVIYDGVNGEQAVNWFNEHILGLSYEESSKIVLSTFKAKENY